MWQRWPCGKSPPLFSARKSWKEKIAQLQGKTVRGMIGAEEHRKVKMKGASNMELTYRQEGDYLFPNLSVPEAPRVGKYGMLRRTFLRRNRNGIYTGMQLTGKLNAHLEEIDRQATEMMGQLVAQMAREQGVTEDLKAQDQMKWVGLMNSIRAAAEEMVLRELIYS